MSNGLVQNAGIEAFLNIEDDDGVGFCLEDGFFGDISSFTHTSWGGTMCSEMDEDDLPLTNYLLKFNGDEEEPWESGEELSVGGDSVEDDEICEFGWAMEPNELETGMLNAAEFSYNKENPFDKVSLQKEKLSPVKKTEKASKKEPAKKNVVEGKKQTKNSAGKDIVKVADSVHSEVKSTKSMTDAKLAVKNVNNSTKKEPQNSQTAAKTQAEKAKEQRERKKKYVQELQDTIAELKRDKAGLQQVNAQLSDKVESLREEISYLKGVITNQSELATILRSVTNTPGISVSCSVLQDNEGNSGKNNKRKSAPAGKEGVDLHHKNNKKRKLDKNSTGEMGSNAGVCVHVQSNKVSLEFCAECSKKANSIVT